MFFYQISFVRILFSVYPNHSPRTRCIHINSLSSTYNIISCFIDFFLSFLTWATFTHLKWALNWNCHSKYGVQSITVIWNKKRCHYLIRFNRNCTNVWQKTTITITKKQDLWEFKIQRKRKRRRRKSIKRFFRRTVWSSNVSGQTCLHHFIEKSIKAWNCEHINFKSTECDGIYLEVISFVIISIFNDSMKNNENELDMN